MKRLFVLSVDDDATVAQRDAITEYLRSQGFGFWHHITNTWVVADLLGRATVLGLRDKAHELAGPANVLVVQVSPSVTWATYSPTAGHKWLQEYID